MRASRAVAWIVVLSLLAPVAAGGIVQDDGPCVGTVTAPADGTTVVSVQGFATHEGEKRPTYIVGVGPRGGIEWVFPTADRLDAFWTYDVDPLDDGNLFVTGTRPGVTLFFEFDPRSGDVVWSEQADFDDTHDADLLDEHRILLANMRGYDEETGENDDGLVIYNRTSGEVEWRWLFRDHGFDPDGGGNYSDDWTHVNDVDRVREGEYLASVRNFDQVILVNRSTGEVDLRLGEDGDTSVLDHQHNPQYLESDDGDPTLLVADSDNDRVVEYEREADGEWERTWSVGEEDGRLQWPRDADRLPDGNTLVVDSLGHRVLEVAPDGEVVWEFYTPWLPYDAERIELGDEPGGPTMRDAGSTGTKTLANGKPRHVDDIDECASALVPTGNESGVTATEEPSDDDDRTAGTGRTADDGRTAVDATADGDATSSPGQPGFGTLAALAAVAVLVALARYRS